MYHLLDAEWLKLRKSKITFIMFVGPIVGMILGLTVSTDMFPDEINHWFSTLMVMNLTYALLFLPLITGVLASTICRYEHQAGGWKQLLALPVTRGKVFIAKYLLLIVLIFAMQVLYLGAVVTIGFIHQYTDPFPMEIVWKSILGGWVATFPLAALQLWMSLMFKSFAAPLAVNVIFTLPAILAVNSEKVGPYYPWAQPFSMMYIGGDTKDVFFIPWEQLITVVGGGFLLFFLCGYIYFQRKAV
ncbi:ABC transporter permease [Caldibacillus lycopersici]|uniref:ABC transporter permease n=1 Tax=Perspicuibacillus lycopersici TaxID=1325689 RepID=A0AAE3LRD8_9BACI|nr:ABC transporter permease [Perspicuibacillus lycopersici]MCU9614529.1 ABC transporter permease [Perspicuibacillus lycopersici]